MELQGIKNIIFDLGNVIININHDKAIAAFKELFGSHYPDMEKNLTASNILEKYETAEINTDDFIAFFKSYHPELTDKEIIEAWNSMLLDIPKERLELINQLGLQYRVFLLSNTNQIHLDYINDYVTKHFDINSISEPFEKGYYSHEMRLRKPNPKIFEAILADKNLLAEETLFIDDSEEHIIASKQLNLKTHHLLATESIIDIFKDEN